MGAHHLHRQVRTVLLDGTHRQDHRRVLLGQAAELQRGSGGSSAQCMSATVQGPTRGTVPMMMVFDLV